MTSKKHKVESLGEHWRRRMHIIVFDDASEVSARTRLALARMISRDLRMEEVGL